MVVSGCGLIGPSEQEKQIVAQKEVYKEQAQQTNQVLISRRLELQYPPKVLLTPAASNFQQSLIEHFSQPIVPTDPVAVNSNLQAAKVDAIEDSAVKGSSGGGSNDDYIPDGDAVFLITQAAKADDIAEKFNRLQQYTIKILQTVEAANNVSINPVQKWRHK